MRIVFIAETFSEKMGYLENTLPKYLSKLGADVHVISADLPPNYRLRDYKQIYGKFDGGAEARQPGTVEHLNGFTLHILGHRKVLGYVRMVGLFDKLRELRPDVVQSMASVGWLPLDSAMFRPFLGYKLFTGCSTTASVFPLAQREHHLWDPERVKTILLRTVPGYLISLMTSQSFPATVDCADVACRFMGVPRRLVEISPLGVDTDLFSPIGNTADQQMRADLRGRLGFSENEVVCIYSGRFTDDKRPLVLAKAVAKLNMAGEPYKGLFVGDGVQKDAIEEQRGCVVHPFVPFTELARYFHAADIGVWPAQESMSMLDAAACGLPIIVNDTLKAVERIDGNGLTYRLGDVDDLARVLLSLKEPEARKRLGECGAERMSKQFGWGKIAEERLRKYEQFVGK